jgi:signal transduction histidine kinase
LIPRVIGGRFWPKSWTVQRKIVAASVVPLMLVVPALTVFLWLYGNSTYDAILTNKVRSDLATAQQYFLRLEESQTQRLLGYAEGDDLAQAYRARGVSGLESLLPGMRTGARLSYLVFHSRKSLNDPYLGSSAFVFDNGGVRSGLIVLSSQMLSRHAEELTGATRVPILPTPAAAPDDREVLTDNLVMQSLVKVVIDGQWLGVLEGGSVLNRDLSLVDSIHDIVYPNGALMAESRGTVTVFLDDVRVATNVQLSAGMRAIGTRVSAAVKEKVLGRGESWFDKAFVVNDWYVSGYAPLQDVFGNRVGMLYVGFLEGPYRALKERVLMLLLMVAGAASVFSVFLGTQLARGVFDPLFRMNYTMSRVESGDKDARVGGLGRQDEFAELADHFDRLLDKLASRQAELEQLNCALDGKVNERTADLLQANQMLRAAQDQMIASERLATIGQLTAGVAHEVNNPLAVMQGHLDLMREALINGDSIAHEIRLLDEQVQRMRQIVQKLLQFVRPETYVGYVDQQLDVNEVVRDCLVLVEQELRKARIRPVLQLGCTQTAAISRTELQQVLVNLLINAVHAATDNPQARGVVPTIWVTARDVEHGAESGVEIVVENNGPLIRPDEQELIFELFYTTKQSRGTGLGLPISRMLLQRYGGSLLLESPVRQPIDPQACPTEGARFTAHVLKQPRFSSDMIRQAISMTGHQS